MPEPPHGDPPQQSELRQSVVQPRGEAAEYECDEHGRLSVLIEVPQEYNETWHLQFTIRQLKSPDLFFTKSANEISYINIGYMS